MVELGDSTLREFLKEHNMGITTLANLLHISRCTIRRYEEDRNRCTDESRKIIELALRVIKEENLVRPVLSKSEMVNIEDNYCLREAHLRKVLKFERDFREKIRANGGEIR